MAKVIEPIRTPRPARSRKPSKGQQVGYLRVSSCAACSTSDTSLLSGPSHIAYAAWSGRFFIRESATSSKASHPNQSSSSIVPNTSRNNFVNLATTSRSLLPTELRHRTPGPNPGGGDFRRSCRLYGSYRVLARIDMESAATSILSHFTE
jgi:hypothetical protein